MTYGPNLGMIINASTGDAYDSDLRNLLRTLDVLVQPAVISKTLSAPPGSPANGDRYIVAASPTGGWSSFAAGDFVVWTTDDPTHPSGFWQDRTPKKGWIVYNIADTTFYYYSGTAWLSLGTSSTTLGALTDVTLTSPANNDVLTYETSSTKWKNKRITLAGDDDVVISSPANNDVLTYETSSTKWKNKPGVGTTLAGDTDVVISSPANNDVLTYETSSTKWKNKPASGGGGGIPSGSNVILIGDIDGSDGGYATLSLALKINSSFIANQASAVKIGFHVNSGTLTVGAAVLRTSTRGATTYDAGSTAITWGGSATPTFSAGDNVSDAITYTIDGTKDVWIIIYFSAGSADNLNKYDSGGAGQIWGYASGDKTAVSTIPSFVLSRAGIYKVVTA